MNTRPLTAVRSLLLIATLLAPPIAHAHHAMGNATPATLFQGLVSGLAHPVIGIDHLLFVLAVGAAGYFFGRRVGLPVAFVAGTLAGTGMHLYEATLPYADAWVALTIVALGALFIFGARLLRSGAALALFAVGGLIHGYAYGEAIVGAEATPLVAYLVGFALVQLAIAFGAYVVTQHAAREGRGAALARPIGAALSLAGVVFLASAIWV